MSKDDKVGGSSSTMPATMNPMELGKSPAGTKVFILTPEILKKLGLGGHMATRIAAQGEVKKEKSPMTKSQENLGDKSQQPVKTPARDINQTASSNKRRRESISTENSQETHEAGKSFSTQSEQRLNGTNQETQAVANKLEETLTPKATKRRRRSNALDMLGIRSPDISSENAKESVDESTKITPGVRTSKRAVKVKKFDDYILTDDVLTTHVDSGNTCAKIRRRRSSASAKKTKAESNVSEKEQIEANSGDKHASENDKTPGKKIDADNPKQESSDAKRRLSSQKIELKASEPGNDSGKNKPRKSYGKLKPKEKDTAVEENRVVEKTSKPETEAAASNSETPKMKKNLCTVKGYIAVTQSSISVSRKELFKKDLKPRPKKTPATETSTPKKILEVASKVEPSETRSNLPPQKAGLAATPPTIHVGKKELPNECKKLEPKEKSKIETSGLNKATESREAVEALKLKLSRRTSGDSSEKISSDAQISPNDSRRVIPKMFEKRKPKEKLSEINVGLGVAKEEKEAMQKVSAATKSQLSEKIGVTAGPASGDSSEKISSGAAQIPPNERKRIIPKMFEKRKPKEKLSEKPVGLGDAREKEEEEAMQKDSEGTKSLLPEKIGATASQITSSSAEEKRSEHRETSPKEDSESVVFMQGNTEAERSLFGEGTGFTDVQTATEKPKEKIEPAALTEENLKAEQWLSAEETRFAGINKNQVPKTYVKRKLKEKLVGLAEGQKSREAVETSVISETKNSISTERLSVHLPKSQTKPEIPAAKDSTLKNRSSTSSSQSPFKSPRLEKARASKTKTLSSLIKNKKPNDAQPKILMSSPEKLLLDTKPNSQGSRSEPEKSVNAEPVPLLLPDKTEEVGDLQSDFPKSQAGEEKVVASELKSPMPSVHPEEVIASELKSPVPSVHAEEVIASELESPVPSVHPEEVIGSELKSPVPSVHPEEVIASELKSPVPSVHPEEVIASELESPVPSVHPEEVITSGLESPVPSVQTEEVIIYELESAMSTSDHEEIIVYELESPMSPAVEEEVVSESQLRTSPAAKEEEIVVSKLQLPTSPAAKEEVVSELQLPTSPPAKEEKSAASKSDPTLHPDEEARDVASAPASPICPKDSGESFDLHIDSPMPQVNKEEPVVSNAEPPTPPPKNEAIVAELESPKTEKQLSSAKLKPPSKKSTKEDTRIAKNSNSHDKNQISANRGTRKAEIKMSSNKSSSMKAKKLNESHPEEILASDEPAAVEPRVPRKRGRPRKPPPEPEVLPEPEVEPEPISSKEEPGVESSAPTTDDTTSVDNTSRVKKPAPRYADEIDGKGLSDGSEDEEVAEVKSTKRRGRPAVAINRAPSGGRRSRGRRRGRGRGRSSAAADSDYVPKASGNSNQENGGAVGPQEATDNSETLVVCTKCETSLPKKQWARHNMAVHNGMSWLVGTEQPDFENDVRLFRSVLTAALKKKSSLTCETCGVAKRSANGFMSHLQFCGKTDEERQSLLMTCPICKHVMMPSSMEMHERTHRPVEKTAQERKWEEAVEARDASSGRGKRKAAEKAATKILEFTGLVKDDGNAKKVVPEEELKDLIKRPRLPNDIPGVWKGIWKTELATNGKAFCRQTICQFTAKSVEAMCEHSATCKFTPRPTYLCKMCHFSSPTEEVVLNHVRDKHGEGRPDSGSDFGISCSSEDDSAPEVEAKVPIQKKEVDRYRPQSTGIRFLDIEPPIHPKFPVSYPPAVRWTMEFEANNYRLRLFEGLSPRPMNLLEHEKSREYLPELSRSMKVKLAEKRNDPADSWIRWERFEGSVNKGVPTLFTGGPVWALAWLPIPAPLYNLTVDQYVAISTHPTMESAYSVGQSYTGKNVIQIWNMGHLDHTKNLALKAPKFSYGVAHDKGTVWCMEWCPSGCYEYETFGETSAAKGDSKSRMGLLAAACSDGCVHIFSLPFPDELKFVRKESDPPDYRPIYDTKPVMTLTVSVSGYEKGEQNWQCTCLNWSRSLGHDTIIAGFSNGFVALWDPTTTSPLLVNTRGETTIIDAFHNFYAHGHSVSSVHMIPMGGKRFFYTTGYDRLSKLWDMEDLTMNVCTAKRGIVTAGALLSNWAACVTAYDDAYGLANTHTYLMSLRQPATKVLPLLPTKTTIYGVATSDYGNSISQGTLAGEVLVMFPHQMWCYKDMDRDLPKKRWLASSVQAVDFKAEPNAKTVKTGVKRKTTDKEYNYKPDTYEGCEERYGIIFRDDLNRAKHDVGRARSKPTYNERLATCNIEQYHFASVNRVAWNPNAWSYLWLCVGYNNGLVRFLNFNVVAIDRELRKFLPSHVNTILKNAGIARADAAQSENDRGDDQPKS